MDVMYVGGSQRFQRQLLGAINRHIKVLSRDGELPVPELIALQAVLRDATADARRRQEASSMASTIRPAEDADMQLATAPLMVTQSHAARLLSLSKRTIQRRIADGRLPATRIGRNVRISREAIDALIAEREGTAPTAQDGTSEAAAE